jgi:hypothetical protein
MSIQLMPERGKKKKRKEGKKNQNNWVFNVSLMMFVVECAEMCEKRSERKSWKIEISKHQEGKVYGE